MGEKIKAKVGKARSWPQHSPPTASFPTATVGEVRKGLTLKFVPKFDYRIRLDILITNNRAFYHLNSTEKSHEMAQIFTWGKGKCKKQQQQTETKLFHNYSPLSFSDGPVQRPTSLENDILMEETKIRKQ